MKGRKLYLTLVIIYLSFFLLVFSRHLIFSALGMETNVEEVKTIHHVRAENAWNIVHADTCLSLVKDGDIVLRSGVDRMSELFKSQNAVDRAYSHAGIIMIENGYPMVYNMNADAKNPHLPIRRDSLINFVSPFDNIAYAVYRNPIGEKEIKNLKTTLVNWYNERLPFDPHFNLDIDTALYGNEMVAKAMTMVSHDSSYFKTTFAGEYEFVSTDNLFKHEEIKLICKIVYRQ